MKSRREIIVIGSGIAGLIAAIELSAAHDVTLVTKSELSESNTRWAQGGIAAAMFPDDSVAEHEADTLRAGAGLCDPAAVHVLCAEGPARVRDLIRMGVAFDQKDGQPARGLEAAHSRARVLHAQGDATGLSIELALVATLRNCNVRVLEHAFAQDLVLRNGAVAGLGILDADDKPQALSADAVILASGGAGQMYLHTTNPAGATGDGLALALRAGAQLADLEFYQFHPTALATPGTFLISEAVRGEGAVLLDANGRRFMQSLHEGAELAPRDVVARGIAMQMAQQNGQPVLLDATRLGSDFLRHRFPSIDAACRARGLDWSKEPIPVTPAAHYWMGGVRTDLLGRTSIPELFAVGEVACTGAHGANRLASNSLLESLVFAWRCAHFLLKDPLATETAAWPDLHTSSGMISIDTLTSQQATTMDRHALQSLMWNSAGIERNGGALEDAARTLRNARATGTTRAALETVNLLTLAQATVAMALRRQESRGAHFRTDFPETSPVWQHSQVLTQKVAVPC